MGVSEDYGRRLLPAVVDDLAQESPDHILYAFPKAGTLDQGFRDVSARQFANAVNRTARWLEMTMGRRSTSFETIAYIGPREFSFQFSSCCSSIIFIVCYHA